MSDNTYYPFPTGYRISRLTLLTNHQRQWIFNCKESSYSLAKKLNCKPSFVRTIRWIGRKNGNQWNSRGRRKVLDDLSIANLQKKANTQLTYEGAISLLHDEYSASFNRRHSEEFQLVSNNKRLRMPPQARLRYMSTFFPGLKRARNTAKRPVDADSTETHFIPRKRTFLGSIWDAVTNFSWVTHEASVRNARWNTFNLQPGAHTYNSKL